MTGAVVFDHVWKKFRRGERHDSLRDLIPSLFRRTLKGEELGGEEFWALKDVSFEVQAGEALGIIGGNGAGKSTALKLLTKILRPSQGACAVSGRVGALIEVAAGFHPDLTGRENVFLQGAILGMRRADVARKFDAIVDFAGVSEFIDTPVKRYSSGMNARLGFAIAVNLDPDVLIIDEVLSVGDMAFQQRCVQHMRNFKARGVAIVFVSHNSQAVGDLCDRAVYLDRGTVRASGPTALVLEAYTKSGMASSATAGLLGATIERVRLVDGAGDAVDQVEPGTPLFLHVDYTVPAALTDLTFAVGLMRSTDNLNVYSAHFAEAELGLERVVPTAGDASMRSLHAVYRFRANVSRGHYHLNFTIFHNPTQQELHRVNGAARVAVQELRTSGGVADLGMTVEGTARDADSGRD